MTKEQDFYLKEFKDHQSYENFFTCRRAGLDTMELLALVPQERRDKFFKTAVRLGLEDLDYKYGYDEGEKPANH